MTVEEIKKAVDNGKVVHWSNDSYIVIKDKNDNYLIKYIPNNNVIGLTWKDNTTLNGIESKFYIKNN